MSVIGLNTSDLNEFYKPLTVLEQLFGNDEDSPLSRLFLYVVVKDAQLEEIAQDAIREGGEFEEGDEIPKVTSIAVAVPFSSDVCYYLTGTGLMIGDNEDFVYTSDGGEGMRKGSFMHGSGRTKVGINKITAFALADDDMSLEEFLQTHGPQTAAKPEVVAPVEEPLEEAPVEPTPEPTPTPTPEPPIERTKEVSSSLKSASPKGIDKVLIAGKPLSELKVTEVIELGDFVTDHKSGSYLHAETNGNEWLFYSNDPKEGMAAVRRMLMLKLDLDDEPEVSALNYQEVAALLEGVVDDQE